jgi:peptidoglycan-associated lipoprotein
VQRRPPFARWGGMTKNAQARLALTATCAALALSACATVRDRLMAAPPRCVETTVPIYFDAGSAELTDESRTALAGAATETAGCRLERVAVIGLADAEGGAQENLELSKRRAAAVAEALAAVKLPAAEFRMAAAGEAFALTPTGAAEPLRRRVDIVLQMKP